METKPFEQVYVKIEKEEEVQRRPEELKDILEIKAEPEMIQVKVEEQFFEHLHTEEVTENMDDFNSFVLNGNMKEDRSEEEYYEVPMNKPSTSRGLHQRIIYNMTDQVFNLNFVAEVEKHEELYNYNLPGYSRKDVTEKAWQEVGAALNMSVTDCKKKWRNFRTVFLRKMKPASGSGTKKKSYYLEEAMQFCLPFIKTAAPPSSGNFEPIPRTQPLINNNMKSQTQVDDSVTQAEDNIQSEDSATQFVEAFASTQETCLSSELLSTKPSFQGSDRPCPTSSSLRRTLGLNIKKQNKNSAADLSVAEYSNAKKAKLQSNNEVENSTNKVDKQEGLKMFLLSLLPELEELNDSQIKLFKRQVFRVIDDIAASGNQPQTPAGSTIPSSPSPSYSTSSQNMSNFGTFETHSANDITVSVYQPQSPAGFT